MVRTVFGARVQVLAAALLFSTGGAAIKATAFTPWQVAGLRSAIAAVTVLALMPVARRRPSGAALLVGVAYAATLTLFVLANRWTTATNAIFLQATATLHLLVLGPWILREPIRRGEGPTAIVIGLGMGALLLDRHAPTSLATAPLLGNVVAGISGLTWACTVLGLRFLGRRQEPPAHAVVVGNVLVCVVTLPLSLPIAAVGVADWAWVIYLGVFQVGLAYVLLSHAFGRVRALEAALLLLLEPVLNPLFTYALHGEVPGPWSMAGGALILAGVARQAWSRESPSAES